MQGIVGAGGISRLDGINPEGSCILPVIVADMTLYALPVDGSVLDQFGEYIFIGILISRGTDAAQIWRDDLRDMAQKLQITGIQRSVFFNQYQPGAEFIFPEDLLVGQVIADPAVFWLQDLRNIPEGIVDVLAEDLEKIHRFNGTETVFFQILPFLIHILGSVLGTEGNGLVVSV